LFKFDEIFDKISDVCDESAFQQSASWLFCYFAPELEHDYPDLFLRLKSKIFRGKEQHKFPAVFKIFFEKLDKFKENDWLRLKKECNYFTNSETLTSRILADDVSTLKELSCHPRFTIETRILLNIF
jgi:hypothetical protein